MVLPTSFFGPVSWYEPLARATEPVYIEAHENFQKQTLRTRCRIATANGVQTLTVSVSGSGTIKDIKIDNQEVIGAKFVTINEFKKMLKDGEIIESLSYFIDVYQNYIN